MLEKKHCFICLEEDDDQLISHCNCNLKAHIQCFENLLRYEIKLGKKSGCAICKHNYTYKTTKAVRLLVFDGILAFLVVIIIIQLTIFVLFLIFDSQNDNAVIISAIFLYASVISYIFMSLVFRRQTSQWKWWNFKSLDVCTVVQTANNFTFTIKNDDSSNTCIQMHGTVIYVNFNANILCFVR